MGEPYKKVGRGGAGNFYSKKDVQGVAKASVASDLESQTSPSSNYPTADLVRALSSSQPPPEYLHTGRGGAGNWIQPSELTSQGLAQVASPDATSTTSPTSSPSNPTKPNIATSKRVLGGAKPTYKGGRGGAGNYTDFAEEERLRREEEERVKREREERITKDVEAGLARPPKAYGGAGGAWEMGDMK